MKGQLPPTNMDSYGTGIEIGEKVKAEIAAKVVRILLPILAGTVVISSLLILAATPDQPLRFVPGFILLFLLTVIWFIARKGHIITASNLLIATGSIAIISGMYFNGGVLAPIFASIIVCTGLVSWFYRAKTAVLYSIGWLITGGLFVILAENSLLPNAENPTPLLQWSLFSVYMFVLLIISIIPNKMLHESLQNVENSARELKVSEERLDLAIKGTGVGLWDWKVQTGEMVFNERWAEIIGYSLDEIEPVSIETWQKFCHPDDLKRSTELLEQHFKGVTDFYKCEVRMRHKNGKWIWILDRGKVFEWDKEGKPVRMAGTHADITERKQAEEQLLDYQEKLKSLASQLSVIEERERHRLATELHDQIGQSLVMSKMKLDSLRQLMSSGEFTGVLGEVCNCLGDVIRETRMLTFDLSSPILYELGFETAVTEWLDEQIKEKHGIRTEFIDDGQPKPLDDDIRALLFRNVRELLINIVKHAKAQKVTVSVSKVDEQICVMIEDDGVGFEPDKIGSNSGFGIFSIRERLEQLEGHLEIESEPGHGSRFTMTAPLKVEKSTEGVEV